MNMSSGGNLRVADSHPSCETCGNFSYANGGAMLGKGRCNLLERYVHATFLCDNHQDMRYTTIVDKTTNAR